MTARTRRLVDNDGGRPVVYAVPLTWHIFLKKQHTVHSLSQVFLHISFPQQRHESRQLVEEALVTWQPETVTTDRYGFESKSKIEVFLHARDLIDKDIDVKEGDFFSYGTTFFEITSIITDKEMFGQVEHVTGFKLMGTQAREGQINFQPLGLLIEMLLYHLILLKRILFHFQV